MPISLYFLFISHSRKSQTYIKKVNESNKLII